MPRKKRSHSNEDRESKINRLGSYNLRNTRSRGYESAEESVLKDERSVSGGRYGKRKRSGRGRS